MGSFHIHTDRPPALSQICRCGQRYACRKCWRYGQWRSFKRIRDNLTAHLTDDRRAVHAIVKVDSENWDWMLDHALAALRHAGEIRQRHIRRRKPGPLSGIVCGEWYPHFVIASGAVRPHFHGGLIIDAGHDPTSITDELEEVMRVFGASVYLAGQRKPNTISGYLTRERLHDEPKRQRDIELKMKGKRWPSWRPPAQQPKANPVTYRSGQDARHIAWDDHWQTVAVIAREVIGPAWLEGIGKTPAARQRLAKLHRVIEAAHIDATASGRDSIELSVRRIAELIGEPKSSIDRDLQLLTHHGIIERIHTTKGNPTEYRYHGYQPSPTTASSDNTATSHATDQRR